MIDLKPLGRGQKLLILAAFIVNDEENTFSGHNTRWAETVDLVLEGRRGLFDYSDKELDEEIGGILVDAEWLTDIGVSDAEGLYAWARKESKMGVVDPVGKSWDAVPEEEQDGWSKL